MTVPQHLAALERANEVRLRRVALKRSIRAGETMPAEIFSEPIPEWLEKMPVGKLLEAIRYLPRNTLSNWLAEVGLSETREIGQFTTRQRTLLALRIGAWEGSPQRKGRKGLSV